MLPKSMGFLSIHRTSSIWEIRIHADEQFPCLGFSLPPPPCGLLQMSDVSPRQLRRNLVATQTMASSLSLFQGSDESIIARAASSRIARTTTSSGGSLGPSSFHVIGAPKQ
jgi:hypothetical protein